MHREYFAALFVQVLKFRHVAIDEAKVRANASKHKAMSYKRMFEEERRLRAEVERLLGEADAADASEDARHGAGARSDAQGGLAVHTAPAILRSPLHLRPQHHQRRAIQAHPRVRIDHPRMPPLRPEHVVDQM